MPREHKLRVVACGLGALIVLMLRPLHAQEQIADATFDVGVAVPAYERNGPTVAIDRAHRNFHTADGRYKPFADLLRNDGYRVIAYNYTFDADHLKGVDILVIANAGARWGTTCRCRPSAPPSVTRFVTGFAMADRSC